MKHPHMTHKLVTKTGVVVFRRSQRTRADDVAGHMQSSLLVTGGDLMIDPVQVNREDQRKGKHK